MNPVQGQDLRSTCGRARVHYDPAWSPSRPFLTFADGTAGARFTTLDGALRRLRDKGFRFDKELTWK